MCNVVVIYDAVWYLARVEGEEEDEEVDGMTFVNFMARKGFIWGQKDQLQVLNEDILMEVSPVPVTSRYTGVTKDGLKKN